MGELPKQSANEEAVLRDWREGYQATDQPMPGVTVEFVETQGMGRTPLDDLRDEVENA